MKLRVAILHPFGPAVERRVRTLAGEDFDIAFASSSRETDLAAAITDADFAVAFTSAVSSAVFAAAPRLRLLHKWGTGVDNIDLAAARRHGVTVANTPGRNAGAVADLSIGLMLAVLRRIPAAQARLRTGDWNTDDIWLSASGLAGKTVGLIGFGAIGREVANRLRGFGCPVLYHKRIRLDRDEEDRLNAAWLPLNDLLEQSDIVSLHLPLTPETRGILGAAELGRMRRSAILINVGRGGLVDEDALTEALEAGLICGAGLDVFEQEPPAPHNRLLAIESVVATPHIGGKTAENLDATIGHWLTNLRRVASGQALPPADIVLAPIIHDL